MKILHVLNSNRFSGAENVVCQIAGIYKKCSDVEIVYCSPEGEIREALADRKITYISVGESLTVSALKNVIEEQTPDIIHAHDMKASFVVSLVCGNVPYISHIHNNAFDSRGVSLKSIVYFCAALKAKHILWVSNSAFNGYKFHKFFEKKSTVLYNIINEEDLYAKMGKDPNSYMYDVVYVGRLTYPKNPQRLMKIFSQIVHDMPKVKMAVIGTGELEEEIRGLCRELKLEENVTFLGFQKNPLKILHDAKVMVMTSRWEGMPMCALESIALGVPIVSTPTDGLKELVINGENGFLSDDDSVLKDRIVEIVGDNQLHSKLSKNALKTSREINDVERYKSILDRIYN
ncbi:MAG: glycosyltransferase [Agathobacter sp.]|nr:glycosyltransferase [Agathobacter sp.]